MSSTAKPGAHDPAGQGRDVFRLTDPQSLRALTHPIRLALLEALDAEGPLTATQAGELIGQAANTCSFHFRQLAKYGFIEEAGQGPGHARPWRLKTGAIDLPDLSGTSDTAVAGRALKGLVLERYFARISAFEEARDGYPAAWRDAADFNQKTIHLTPAELKAVDAELTAVLDRYRERNADPALRPPDSLPVEVLTFAYPIRPARP